MEKEDVGVENILVKVGVVDVSDCDGEDCFRLFLDSNRRLVWFAVVIWRFVTCNVGFDDDLFCLTALRCILIIDNATDCCWHLCRYCCWGLSIGKGSIGL